MTFMTANGTADRHVATPTPRPALRAEEPELAAGLAELRDEIRADKKLVERIRKKFEIKNTTGYRLCAFLDADEPVEIFRRLIVGSEGTLALICDATFETLPVPATHHDRVAPLRRASPRPARPCPTWSSSGRARSS